MTETTLPEDHHARITYAIERGLGLNNWDLIAPLNGGFSGAYVYTINVGGKVYVVKLNDLRNQDTDPARYYPNIEEASQNNLAPKLYFSDTAQGVLLMECIKSRPIPRADEKCMQKVADLVSQLHSTASFKEWRTVFNILDHFYQMLSKEHHESQMLTNCMQQAKVLEKSLSVPEDYKPCHCDLNPNNLLFNGRDYFLIDWEASSKQSFYFDLACCAIFFYFFDEEKCESFLKLYFQREPNEIEKAKYFLMRVFANIYYGTIFISVPFQNEIHIDPLSQAEIDELPTYMEFMQGIGSKMVDLDSAEIQQKFGYAYLNTAIAQINTPDYKKSLEILR